MCIMPSITLDQFQNRLSINNSLSLSLQTATAIVLPISTTVFLGKLRFYGKTNQVVQTKSSRGHLTKQKKNSPKQEKIKQKLANHVHVPESDQMPSHL